MEEKSPLFSKALDRTRFAPITLGPDVHTAPAFGLASTCHRFTSFRPLSKGGIR